MFDCSKVLVTGANGFIGSHMVARMLQENANVAILVRPDSDFWRLKEFVGEVSIYKADLRDRSRLNKYISEIKPDYVFHLGAYGINPRQNDGITATEVNILGSINLIESLRAEGCRKIVNVGTGMEYGDKEGLIQEDTQLAPVNIYGATKAAATIMAHRLAREYSMDIITLRAFSIFGEKEASNRFFPYIILSVLNNSELVLTGCTQYRDYNYVGNLINGLVLAARSNLKNEVLNIGSGEVHQLKDYVNFILKIMNCSMVPRFGAAPYRPNELWRVQPDISQIKTLLNWEPSISLETGIERTIFWYKRNLERFF